MVCRAFLGALARQGMPVRCEQGNRGAGRVVQRRHSPRCCRGYLGGVSPVAPASAFSQPSPSSDAPLQSSPARFACLGVDGAESDFTSDLVAQGSHTLHRPVLVLILYFCASARNGSACHLNSGGIRAAIFSISSATKSSPRMVRAVYPSPYSMR